MKNDKMTEIDERIELLTVNVCKCNCIYNAP